MIPFPLFKVCADRMGTVGLMSSDDEVVISDDDNKDISGDTSDDDNKDTSEDTSIATGQDFEMMMELAMSDHQSWLRDKVDKVVNVLAAKDPIVMTENIVELITQRNHLMDICDSYVEAKWNDDASEVQTLREQILERLIQFFYDFMEHVDFDGDVQYVVDVLAAYQEVWDALFG